MSLQAVYENSMRRVNAIHFIGIGGAGMSGIAEVLHTQGFHVSGSDMQPSSVTDRLASLGIKVRIGHCSNAIEMADVVVVSSAIEKNNVEIMAAKERSIPIVPRAEMLSELMRFRFGIAIAGTHGKTTTTSMVASLLTSAGFEPTFIVGGQVNSFNSNAQLGKGQYIVAEADESDGSFLYLQPIISVITNIDYDHLENYENDANKLEHAFIEFIHHVPFYGLVIVCIDDPIIKRLLPKITRPLLTYGLNEDADVRASNIKQNGMDVSFLVTTQEGSFIVKTSCGGTHNVRNSLAAIAVASEIGMLEKKIVSGMQSFMGIKRRFDMVGTFSIGQVSDVIVMDDYAHHPREIEAIFSAVRDGWSDRRMVVVFQPHRFTRTRDLFEEFSEVLSEADVLVISDIYSAGEEAIAGIDARVLCSSIRQRGKVNPLYIGDIDSIPKEIAYVLNDNDILLFLGAGNISKTVDFIKKEWDVCQH